jgi:hypothetical protein
MAPPAARRIVLTLKKKRQQHCSSFETAARPIDAEASAECR